MSSTDVLGGIGSMFRKTFTLGEQSDRVYLDVNGFRVGSFLDQDYFRRSHETFPGWVRDDEMTILEKFDASTREDMRSAAPRRASGMYPYYHIDNDMAAAFDVSFRTGVPLDFVVAAIITGHDRIEDDQIIRSLLRDWKEAAVSRKHQDRENVALQLEYAR